MLIALLRGVRAEALAEVVNGFSEENGRTPQCDHSAPQAQVGQVQPLPPHRRISSPRAG